ncbi:MAG: tetratricopeptide repeat protein [Chloroflexota bacterium]
MHRLVPNFILEKYRAGEYRGRFNAVGMFLDVYGFSKMTDSLMRHGAHGAEVLGAIMHNVFDPLLVRIFEQGGAIIGLAGDGLMALYPCDGDEPATLQRALASAWNMQQFLHQSPEWETVYGSFIISAKVGLALGEAEWGILPSRDGTKATYYFRGTAVDKASAAEHCAQAGEIILTRMLYERYPDELLIQSCEGFCKLEGIAGPLPGRQAIELPPVDVETACRFVPDVLLQAGLQSEFRQAVNLFIRFPNLSDTHLPGLVYTLFDLQARYGGLFTRLDFGDKGCHMLIFWGAPVAHQNDIGRALNFITDLRASVSFALHAGITYHISRAGYMGGELHEDYTCYGWGINLASRFMMSAPVGQVWVDERVVQRVQRRFLFRHVSEQYFKGFAQKQHVYLLQGRKPQLEMLFKGKMVGRLAALAQLDAFIAPLQQGQEAGALLVWGEPGVGKSRLVYEWMRACQTERQSIAWAVCQSDQMLQQSFNPFRYWLRDYFGISHLHETDAAQPRDAARRRFDEKLTALIAALPNPALAAELERLRTVLGALLGLYWPDSHYEQLDAQARYDNTLLALTRLIEAESLRNPLVLVFEDVHFLDDDSLAFLPRLQRALRASPSPCPVALLLTARRQHAALHLDPTLVRNSIELERLTPEELALLASGLLEGPPAPELVQILEARGEGNPFFTEQIIHYLLEKKLLEKSPQGWRMKTAWSPAMLPGDISAVIVARLDQLTHRVRAVIQTAAVLGREFEVLVLAHMLRDDENLPAELDEAERAAIWSPMSEIHYLFKHALVRDTAYAMQMQARRRELHAMAVEALEKLYASTLPSQYESLAYHSVEAQFNEKARRYLELAGNAAMDAYQNTRAEEYFTQAISLTPEEDVETRYRLLIARQQALLPQGKQEAQRVNLNALWELAEKTQDTEKRFTALFEQARHWAESGDSLQYAAAANKALAIAQQAGEPGWIIKAGHALAHAQHQQGLNDLAARQCATCLHLARQDAQHKNMEASLLNLMGLIALENRPTAQAIELFEQSLSIYRERNSPRGAAMVLNNLGMAATSTGDYSRAQEYYRQALQLVHTLGHRPGEGMVLGNLALLGSLQGDYVQARRLAEENLHIARETGSLLHEAFGLINLSSILETLEEADAALPTAGQALQLARQLDNRNLEAWALTYQGHALLARREYAAAETAYQQAIIIRQELAQPILACEPWAGRAHIARQQGDRATMQACTSAILSVIAKNAALDGTDHPLRVYACCALALEALQDQQAAKLWQDAHRLLQQRADSITEAPVRQRFLQAVPWNREILRHRPE